MKTKEQNVLDVIDQIHAKVNNASERALEEANKILSSERNKNFERLEKIASLGFSNSKEVKQAKEDLQQAQLAREKSKWINHYQTRYPQKYILAEDMIAICKEYGLVLGSDRDYIESIPEKNQNEIINFKLLPEDYLYYKGTVRVISQSFEKGEGVIDWQEIAESTYNSLTDNGRIKKTGDGRFANHFISNKDYFLIAAAQNMFNLEGKVVEGTEIKQHIVWDDPIVLKAVKYGYLIVSVWGKELAIERMRNERNN